MVLPRSSLHNVHNSYKCSVGKLAILSLLVLGVSFVHIMLWSSMSSNSTQLSSLQVHHNLNYETSKRRDGRIMYERQDAPSPRNGGILRTEKHRHITNYDRQQDIHRYTVTFDKPRVFYLSYAQTTRFQNRTVTPISTFKNHTVASSSYFWDFEVPYHEECTFMESWQSSFYPTCNVLHQMEQPATLLSTRGSWRTAWLLEHEQKEQEQVVLKMLNFDRDYNEESFHYHQIDAVAMERLTFSKFTIQIYGFCGQSVLVEYAPQDGRSLIKNKKLSSTGRLLMGRDLARGLTDIHSIDTPKSHNATFVHNDVNIANIVASGPRIKFGDFNIGYPLKWNKTIPCGYPQRWQGILWRSPEEIINTTYVSEKTDVYSLGNLLFQTMTRHQPWTWLEPHGRPSLDEIAAAKAQGKTPYIPMKFRNSTDLSIQALYHAIQECFVTDPTRRPTAYQIAYGLTQALRWKEKGIKNVTITREMFYH